VKIFLVFLGVTLIAFSPLGFGAMSPESYKSQADNDATVAIRLQQQAFELVQRNPSNRGNLKAAMNLFIQAGQLFEKSANTYSALGDSAEDAAQASKAMQACLDMIKQIQERLSMLNRKRF